MKKKITIISLLVICLFLGWCSYSRHVWQKVMMGYELDPIEQGEWLATDFSDHLGVDGYQPEWTKHYFIQGFREHTQLIVAHPSPDFTARLFQRIKGDSSNYSIDCGPESLATYFADDSSRQIPIWWDYASQGEIDCVRLRLDDWEYVFGYAKENIILYMVIENY